MRTSLLHFFTVPLCLRGKKNFSGILIFSLLFSLTAFSQQQYETRILRNVVDGKISKYETIEIGLRLPQQQRFFRSFLEDHSRGQNPYAQNFLRVQFVCNNKTYTATAFYFEDAKADEKTNSYVTQESEWPWRVRFAMPDTGLWRCNILVGDPVNMAVPQACSISFQCVNGKNHGYIGIAPDRQHFQFSDGTPFFVLGQNIGWGDAPVLQGQEPWPKIGYYQLYHYMNNLADNGGNYVRIVTAPWSAGIHWNELNVYAQDHAFALDSMLQIAQARGMKIHLCLDLTTGFVAGDIKENQNPIRRAYQKEGMTAADLLKDSAALKSFDQFIRYVYERWAFSPTVATIELMGEQDRWEGYKGREQNFTDFYEHIRNLLKTEFGDDYHFLSTSVSKERMYMCNPSVISFIDVHHYDNDFNCNKKRFNIISSNEARKMNKPFLFGEMGMINGPVNGADAGDYEACSDISMHNAMWATLFMGGVGTGSCWWNWSNDDFRKANFPAVRFFIDSIAKSFVGLTAREWDGNGLETFYETNSSKNFAIGWLHNESSWWGNIMYNCKERNNKPMIRPKDDDKATTVEDRTGNKFVLKGLLPNHIFKITFYDSRIPGKQFSSLKIKTNRFGHLNLKYPAGCADCAFKVE